MKKKRGDIGDGWALCDKTHSIPRQLIKNGETYMT